MQFKYIDPSIQEEWENLTKTNPASGYMQSFFWAEFKNLLGWETFKIGVLDKNKLIGGVIVAKYSHYKDKNILYIPEGPILPYDHPQVEEIFHSLMGEIDKLADLEGKQLTSHIRIEPKLTVLPSFFSRFQKAPIDQQPLRTLMIDLNPSEEQILEQMKPKGRYNIKVAQRYGVEIPQTDPREGLKDFLKLYAQTRKRDLFEGKDSAYFERLIYVLSQTNNAKFFFAKFNNQILSGALVLFWGDIATFLFGASSNLHRETMASYLLHWEIIKEAKKKGCKLYDFYGISPDENDLNHPWQGFTNFKKKFGGLEIRYIGAYDFIYNQKLYQEYLKESEEI